MISRRQPISSGVDAQAGDDGAAVAAVLKSEGGGLNLQQLLKELQKGIRRTGFQSAVDKVLAVRVKLWVQTAVEMSVGFHSSPCWVR